MPRKTTEKEEKDTAKKVAKSASSKKSTKVAIKKTASPKKAKIGNTAKKKVENNSQKEPKAKTTKTKKAVSIENPTKDAEFLVKLFKIITTPKETTKKTTTKEKTVATEKTAKPSAKKTTTPKKETTKKSSTTKKTTAKKTTTTRKKKKVEDVSVSSILEYYDLPYRYNETVVKLLAQTPNILFVYWDISDDDRQRFVQNYGDDFFQNTKPVLIVHNRTKGYAFEVEINDFANSWYLDINDAKSKYTIQLGRKFREKPEMVNIMASTGTESVVLHNDYVPIITSNILEVPNDHILFENLQSKVLYRNVKTGTDSYVEIDNLEFSKRMGKIYSIYDVYKEIYKNEIDSETLSDLLNPSSMSSSKMSSNVFI